jgi:hypothetical protein
MESTPMTVYRETTSAASGPRSFSSEKPAGADSAAVHPEVDLADQVDSRLRVVKGAEFHRLDQGAHPWGLAVENGAAVLPVVASGAAAAGNGAVAVEVSGAAVGEASGDVAVVKWVKGLVIVIDPQPKDRVSESPSISPPITWRETWMATTRSA